MISSGTLRVFVAGELQAAHLKSLGEPVPGIVIQDYLGDFMGLWRTLIGFYEIVESERD